jgi:cell wall-associated NlpC family hydrolase
MGAPAAADPPTTIAEAKAQVEQLEVDAEALDQEALAVKVKLTAGTKALTLKQRDVRQQAAKVARTRRQVAQMALTQFQNLSLDTTAKIFLTQDADGFLDRIATVEKVTENQNRALQDFKDEQAHLAVLERSAKVDVTTLRAADQEMSRLRAASAAKVAQSKAVLARLTAQERARIAAEQRAAELAARRAAEAAAAKAAKEQAAREEAAREQAALDEARSSKSSSSKSSSSRSSDTASTSSSRDFGSSTTTTVRSTGKGATALAYAKKQLGKPYVWGADGPSSFDCSGLTSAAWRAAGISIPRVSRAQSTGAGARVAKSDLQPGDLVFFYTPVSHVAMYVGNGMVIHAPRPGRTVTYQRLDAMPYVGARRPG